MTNHIGAVLKNEFGFLLLIFNAGDLNMRKFLTFFLFQVSIIFTVSSLSAAQTADNLKARVIEIEVPAPALTGNLLETSDIQSAAVYLPPGYDEQPNRRYPVLYLLHGIFDNYGVWIENYDVPAILDRLILSREVPELIVIMPNGGNKYGGGYYRNSPVSGNWGDYVADDLVGFVDDNFRTLAGADSRALVGHSMGGYGALNLA
jgi:enterochelin esterase-like enzyme